MAPIGYFGDYTRFTTLSKEQGGAFLGPDNIVGDFYTIESTYENGERNVWIVNPFGAKMGLISEDFAEKVDLCEAKGWDVTVFLSYVAYTQGEQDDDSNDDNGTYWGEIAVIAYDPQYKEAFTNFAKKLHAKMASGIRPDLKLGNQALQEVIKKNGDYMPSGRIPYPTLKPGEAFVKKERTTTELLVDQVRAGNKGCYFASYVFYGIVILLIIVGIYSLVTSGFFSSFFG